MTAEELPPSVGIDTTTRLSAGQPDEKRKLQKPRF